MKVSAFVGTLGENGRLQSLQEPYWASKAHSSSLLLPAATNQIHRGSQEAGCESLVNIDLHAKYITVKGLCLFRATMYCNNANMR